MIKVDYSCDRCIHAHKELLNGWKPACDAFPDGIPVSMLDVIPEKLPECNNGIRFEEK